MRKITLILLFSVLSLIGYSQTEITSGMSKTQVSSAVNGNIIFLVNYIDPTLITTVDTLSVTHGSTELYALNNTFDTLAQLVSITPDTLYYGMRGRQLRATVNYNFTSIYETLSGELGFSFLIQTGITDSAEVQAVRFLSDATEDSVTISGTKYIYPIDKMTAVYPIVGGTETTHSYNFADTSLYKITFNGTITHDGTGMLSNGSTGYGNTGIKANALTVDDYHLSIFSQTDNRDLAYDIGARATGDNNLLLSSGHNIFSVYSVIGRSYDNYLSHAITNTKGAWCISARDTVNQFYIDGVKSMMYHTMPNEFPDLDIYVLGQNLNDAIYAAGTRKLSFVTIGDGLTDIEAWHKSQIEHEFNNRLSRETTVTGRYIGREVADYPIAITEPPYSFVPDSTDEPNYAIWDGFTKGAMICFQQRSWNASFDYYASSPTFGDSSILDISMGDWISPLDSQNVDYIMFTEMESTGFAWDTMPPFPARLVNKYEAFATYDSRVNPFADKNITQKFIDTCRARGIEPVLYTNPIRNLVFTPSTNFTWQLFDSLDIVHYNNWYQKYMQILVDKYDLNFIWIDAWAYSAFNEAGDGFIDSIYAGNLMKAVDFQGLYDAIKATDSTCLVIMNNWADTTFARFPFDIASNEELVIDIVGRTDNEVVSDSTFINDGNTYYVPSEFICNVAGDVGGGSAFWYATSAAGTDVRPLSQVQDFYDRAVAAGAKFCMSVIPGRDGTIQEEQWEIWRNMIW
jgi:hypothetical protein